MAVAGILRTTEYFAPSVRLGDKSHGDRLPIVAAQTPIGILLERDEFEHLEPIDRVYRALFAAEADPVFSDRAS